MELTFTSQKYEDPVKLKDFQAINSFTYNCKSEDKNMCSYVVQNCLIEVNTDKLGQSKINYQSTTDAQETSALIDTKSIQKTVIVLHEGDQAAEIVTIWCKFYSDTESNCTTRITSMKCESSTKMRQIFQSSYEEITEALTDMQNCEVNSSENGQLWYVTKLNPYKHSFNNNLQRYFDTKDNLVSEWKLGQKHQVMELFIVTDQRDNIFATQTEFQDLLPESVNALTQDYSDSSNEFDMIMIVGTFGLLILAVLIAMAFYVFKKLFPKPIKQRPLFTPKELELKSEYNIPKEGSSKADQNDVTPSDWESLPSMIQKSSTKEQKDKIRSRRQFKEAIKSIDMKVHEIDPDGNCMFRAIALLYFGSDEKHLEVRKVCVNYIKKHQEEFTQFQDGDDSIDQKENLEKHCKTLENAKEWGDESCLQAIVQCFPLEIQVHDQKSGIKPISVYKRDEDIFSDEIIQVIHINFVGGNHYNAMVYSEERLERNKLEADMYYKVVQNKFKDKVNAEENKSLEAGVKVKQQIGQIRKSEKKDNMKNFNILDLQRRLKIATQKQLFAAKAIQYDAQRQVDHYQKKFNDGKRVRKILARAQDFLEDAEQEVNRLEIVLQGNEHEL